MDDCIKVIVVAEGPIAVFKGLAHRSTDVHLSRAQHQPWVGGPPKNVFTLVKPREYALCVSTNQGLRLQIAPDCQKAIGFSQRPGGRWKRIDQA